MIDSMRFKIKGSKEIYNAIKSKGIESVRLNNMDDIPMHVVVYQLVPVKNKTYKIYVQAKDYENFFIEFSLPKVLLDTNIFMVYPEQFTNIFLDVHRTIQSFLGLPIPYHNEWIVQRVDYSYIWKLDNPAQAYWILHNIAKYQYPRKRLTIRDTSVTIEGTSEKIIFYLKHDEFKDVGYKKLNKNNQPLLADYLLEESKSTLRFEVTHKKAKLTSLFGKEVTFKEVLTEENIINNLNKVLQTFFNTDYLVSMTYHEMVESIYNNLSGKEAYNLLGFVNMWYSFDYATRTYNRKFLKQSVSPSTIYKNKQKLKEIGIGILVTNPEFKSIDLSIPNKKAINTSEQVADIAEAIRDLLIL